MFFSGVHELGKGLGYGARFYDPVNGRFNTIDRFAEKYHSMNSYQYGANNPISNIDINGDSIWYSINKNVITMHMRGKVINGSSDNIDMKETVSDMTKVISSAFQGNFEMNGKDYVMKSDIQLEGVSSMDNVSSSDLNCIG